MPGPYCVPGTTPGAAALLVPAGFVRGPAPRYNCHPILQTVGEKPSVGSPALPANQPHVLFSVADLVCTDVEEVAQKCGLSYKVS